jgi:hypothetical protein
MAVTPIIIPLEEPVTVGTGDNEKTYKELVFARKLKGKDLIAMDAVQGNTKKAFAMYASMAGVPLAVMMEIDSDTFEDLALEVAPLMGKRAMKHLKAAQAEAEGKDEGDEPTVN